MQGHERRRDFWRRLKGARRNSQQDFRLRVELGESRKIAILAAARACSHPRRHLKLYHQKRRLEPVRMLEQTVHDRRCYVIGQIAVNAEVLPARELGEIERQDVARDDLDIRKSGRLLLQTRQQRGVQFDGDQPLRLPRQERSHFAAAGADLDPQPAAPRDRPWRRNPGLARSRAGKYQAGNALAPCGAGEEVLPQSLACHSAPV